MLMAMLPFKCFFSLHVFLSVTADNDPAMLLYVTNNIIIITLSKCPGSPNILYMNELLLLYSGNIVLQEF